MEVSERGGCKKQALQRSMSGNEEWLRGLQLRMDCIDAQEDGFCRSNTMDDAQVSTRSRCRTSSHAHLDAWKEVDERTPGTSRGSSASCFVSSLMVRVSRMLGLLRMRRQQQIEPLVSPRTRQDFRTRFSLGEILGSGSFGLVRECESRRGGEVFACKVLERSFKGAAQEDPRIQREIEFLQAVQGHENVLGFHGAFEGQENVFLVTEMCWGGDLYALLDGRHGEGLQEGLVAEIFRQLVEGVQFLHSRGVVHRDLKLENILLKEVVEVNSEGRRSSDSGPITVKVADFGSASFLLPGESVCGEVGSVLYRAPEQLLKARGGHAADVWSMGIILHALLLGELPFMEVSKARLARKVRQGKLAEESDKWSRLSPEARDLLKRMLEPDVKKRAGVMEVKEHPWFSLF